MKVSQQKLLSQSPLMYKQAQEPVTVQPPPNHLICWYLLPALPLLVVLDRAATHQRVTAVGTLMSRLHMTVNVRAARP